MNEQLQMGIQTVALETDSRSRYIHAVRTSALWAAAGDALGWITELSRGPAGVAHRAGVDIVTEPVMWLRNIGGRNGVRVELPAGTYSDDTQLRLAVCRSIRGDGSFDAETFAKIEVTVWPNYALGGGLGTKAAAANLAKRSVNWFSNFFEAGGQSYVKGGGNGAAMRIQPHVWCNISSIDDMLLNVLRDALTTHGHPHGFCGAVFHALCLSRSLEGHGAPGLSEWRSFVERFTDLPRLIGQDPQLAAFWQSTWEGRSGMPLSSAMLIMQNEATGDLQRIEELLNGDPKEAYRRILQTLGCLEPNFRGSGFKTALAAAALANLTERITPHAALAIAANELDSDTDTIATMAGAILGAISGIEPDWPIQDRAYIVEEADRCALIALGESQDSFTYPDLGKWTPPVRQTAAVGTANGQLTLAGLGFLEPIGSGYENGDAIWQWFVLPFGQSVLAKRRASGLSKLSTAQLPGQRQPPGPVAQRRPKTDGAQPSLPLDPSPGLVVQNFEASSTPVRTARDDGLDGWTDMVIQADFDDLALGRAFNRCIDRSGSIEGAVAFAAIIAKAKIARQRRRKS